MTFERRATSPWSVPSVWFLHRAVRLHYFFQPTMPSRLQRGEGGVSHVSRKNSPRIRNPFPVRIPTGGMSARRPFAGRPSARATSPCPPHAVLHNVAWYEYTFDVVTTRSRVLKASSSYFSSSRKGASSARQGPADWVRPRGSTGARGHRISACRSSV